MTNDELRKTKPIWKDSVDTGGMFNTVVAVYFDSDENATHRYLAVASTLGGGAQARRATREEAISYSYELAEKYG